MPLVGVTVTPKLKVPGGSIRNASGGDCPVMLKVRSVAPGGVTSVKVTGKSCWKNCWVTGLNPLKVPVTPNNESSSGVVNVPSVLKLLEVPAGLTVGGVITSGKAV